jgi:hypothetical protein
MKKYWLKKGQKLTQCYLWIGVVHVLVQMVQDAHWGGIGCIPTSLQKIFNIRNMTHTRQKMGRP